MVHLVIESPLICTLEKYGSSSKWRNNIICLIRGKNIIYWKKPKSLHLRWNETVLNMTKLNTLTCSPDLITNSENTNPVFSQNFNHLDCFCLVSVKNTHTKNKICKNYSDWSKNSWKFRFRILEVVSKLKKLTIRL